MAKKKLKQVQKPIDSPSKSSEMKKIEEKKTEKPSETEEQLKKKVESLINIIEELSSNVDKQGMPEVENIIETKLKDLNEKFEYKLQDFKNTLDSLEKKVGRGRSKEDINVFLDEIKKTIEPRFATIEEKLSMLDKLETAGKSIIETNKENEDGVKPAVFQTTGTPSNFELEQIRKSIIEMNQSLSSVKEQIDIIKDGVKVQGFLDSQDIQKLERILLAVEEMIPQKNVIDNFRVTFREIGDLKKRIEDFNSEILKARQTQESHFNNISYRLETLVKYLNSFVEERDVSYSELNTRISELDSKLNDLEKKQEYILNEIKTQKEYGGVISNKIKTLDDVQKDIRNTVSKEDFKKFSLDVHSKFNALGERHQLISNEMKNQKQNLNSILDKVTKFELKIYSQFDNLEKNHQYLLDEAKRQQSAIEDIYNELKILSDLRKISSKEDLKRTEDSLKKNILALQGRIQEIHNNLNKIENSVANKYWVKDVLERERESLMGFVDNKVNRLQKNIEDNTRKNNEIIRKIVSEKRNAEDKLIARKQKISNILKELRS